MFNEVAASYCTRCGTPLAAGARFCGGCGVATSAGAGADLEVPSIELAGVRYELASFWRRLGAFLIDGVVWYLVSLPLSTIFQASAFEDLVAFSGAPEDPAVSWDALAATFDSALVYIGLLTLVTTVAQVSLEGWGWTPGKAVLGMRVMREDGRRPGPVHGLARFTAKFASALVFYLGYLWAAWDPQRQGWHDKAARTYVVRVPESTRGAPRPAVAPGPSPLATGSGPRLWASLGVLYVVFMLAGGLWLAAAVPDDGVAWQRFFERYAVPTPAPTPFRPQIAEVAPTAPLAALIETYSNLEDTRPRA